MINKNKVILMTRMASYEENEGKTDLGICGYFRSDYLSVACLKAIFSATISFGFVFGIYMLYHVDEYMEQIYEMDILGFITQILKYYAEFTIAYVLLVYLIFTVRHAGASRRIKIYHKSLAKLKKMQGGDRK